MKKKFLALVMTLSMALSLVPMTALAAGDQPTEEPKQETQVDAQVEQPKMEPKVEPQEGGDADPVQEKEANADIRINANNLLVNIGERVSAQFTVTPEERTNEILSNTSFSVTEGKSSDITITKTKQSSGTYSVTIYAGDECHAGDSAKVSAIYEGTEIGSFQILIISTAQKHITYSYSESNIEIPQENRRTMPTNVSVPFATPIELSAEWDKEGKIGGSIVSWKWHTTKSEIVEAIEDTSDMQGKANITLYQQKNGAYIFATPIVKIGDKEYLYNYQEQLSPKSSVNPVSCLQPSVTEGQSFDAVFNIQQVPGFNESIPVTWTTRYSEIIGIPDGQQNNRIHVSTYVDSLDYSSTVVSLTASATINGKTYTGNGSIKVIKQTIGSATAVSNLTELMDACNKKLSPIAITETIQLPEGTKLDLGNAQLLKKNTKESSVFTISGKGVFIENGSINGRYIDANTTLISVEEQGDLTLRNLTIQNAKNLTGKGGAVFAKNATITCDNVTFDNNSVCIDHKDDSIEFCGGGAIYADNSDVTIKNSTFINNEAMEANGGAVYLDQHSKGTIQNNTFTSCTAVAGPSYNDVANEITDGAGGAIYCRIAGEVGIYDNKIIGCTAERGGGICVRASNESDITIDRNTIQSCKANYRGGGVSFINVPVSQKESEAVAYASSNKGSHIQLLTGEISDCEAGIGGGIDYTGHGMEPLYLTNVIITGNKAVHAANDSHGGGIWACPWSKTTSYSTLGGAIYGNSADAGADVLYEGSDSVDNWALINGNGYDRASSKMTLSSRALGGGKITWFDDYTNAETTTPADSSLYTNTDKTFGVRGELSAENAQRAEAMANKLVIKNNKATSTLHPYGGGIATNSQIVIGLEGHDKSVTVTKSWSQETHPDSATVTLMQKDADNKSVALETVTLNEENGWTYTFENLPGAYTAPNGDVKDYTYSVSETAISGWTASIKEVDDKDNDAKTIAFEITNSPKRGGSGGGTVTIPDDVPTGLDLKNHYGYIIGYPVDYYTGKPTTDQTKKPVRPEGKITRAEVATIYFRMLTDENRAANWNQVSGFSDVKSSAWYNNAISTLTKAGILKGYEDGTFQPNGYITRAEFATIAIRFFSGVYEGEDLFPDIKGHWAEDYINNAANKGLVKGYEDGTFGPDRYITRAEAVTLVNRTLNRHPHNDGLHQDMLRWPDNMDTSKWYYADMQEATNSHEPDKDKTTADKEYWGKMLPIRDWEALEKEWSNANSAPGEGEVV